jgi:hypothetical protein
LDGLLGILQTKTLWATQYKFLNDYSEIVLFRDKLVSFILPYVREEFEKLVKEFPDIKQKISQEGGMSQTIQYNAELIVDTQYRIIGDEIYILSFCGQHENPHVNSNGLLSQWRGYGAGGGFALVFNTQKMEEMLEIEFNRFQYSAMHLSDLIYSDDENRLKQELSEDLSIMADDVKKIYNRPKLSEKEKGDTLEGYQSFVNCVSRYKHCGFSEENEVRLVVLPTVLDQEFLKLASTEGVILKPEKERKLRNKNDQLVPYIELFNSIDIELPIEKIIVGPHKEKEARAAALSVKLKDTKIEITCSDIPFVG